MTYTCLKVLDTVTMLTSVTPSMLMYEAGGVEQFMYRTNQPVVKAALVHKQHLFSALHTDLA